MKAWGTNQTVFAQAAGTNQSTLSFWLRTKQNHNGMEVKLLDVIHRGFHSLPAFAPTKRYGNNPNSASWYHPNKSSSGSGGGGGSGSGSGSGQQQVLANRHDNEDDDFGENDDDDGIDYSCRPHYQSSSWLKLKLNYLSAAYGLGSCWLQPLQQQQRRQQQPQQALQLQQLLQQQPQQALQQQQQRLQQRQQLIQLQLQFQLNKQQELRFESMAIDALLPKLKVLKAQALKKEEQDRAKAELVYLALKEEQERAMLVHLERTMLVHLALKEEQDRAKAEVKAAKEELVSLRPRRQLPPPKR
jgi:hypothetical protein